MATSLGITLAELKYLRALLAEAEHVAAKLPRNVRRQIVAARLDLTTAELTRLQLAVTRGANGSRERDIVRRLVRDRTLARG